MMCFDLGGPINKVAYAFAVAGLAAGTPANPTPYLIMAAVMCAGMVPPLAMALASTVLARELFTAGRARERQGGLAARRRVHLRGRDPVRRGRPAARHPGVILGGAAPVPSHGDRRHIAGTARRHLRVLRDRQPRHVSCCRSWSRCDHHGRGGRGAQALGAPALGARGARGRRARGRHGLTAARSTSTAGTPSAGDRPSACPAPCGPCAVSASGCRDARASGRCRPRSAAAA